MTTSENSRLQIFFTENISAKINWQRRKILWQIVEFDWHQYHGHTMGGKVNGVGAEATRFEALQAWNFFKLSRWGFIGKILPKQAKMSCFKKISQPKKRTRTVLGFNHSMNNYQWWCRPYGASVDSPLFSFGGVLAEFFFRKLQTFNIFRFFTTVTTCKRFDWFFYTLIKSGNANREYCMSV